MLQQQPRTHLRIIAGAVVLTVGCLSSRPKIRFAHDVCKPRFLRQSALYLFNNSSVMRI